MPKTGENENSKNRKQIIKSTSNHQKVEPKEQKEKKTPTRKKTKTLQSHVKKSDVLKQKLEHIPKDQKDLMEEKNYQDLEQQPNKVRSKKSNSFQKKTNSRKKIDSKKEFKTLEVVVLVLLTCIISLIVGGALGVKFSEKNDQIGNLQVVDKELQDFIKEYNYLVQNYYGELDKKELLNNAFKSMVDSLDDSYSGTIDENASNNFDIELEGKYEGLGIEIINNENMDILIYGIIPNSPASKTELQKGDKLLSVNNINVSGMKTSDFIKEVVKESGVTEFSIQFERNGELHNVLLKKEAITLHSVHSKTYEKNGKKIGYMKVNIFAANTYEQFSAELKKLESAKVDSLVIDLRDNNGGHLTAVKNMISLFLDSSHVIYQTEDHNKKTKVYSTGLETKKYPIVVIGNAMSASASEVMIGALTEEYGATFVGIKSFGKGTVQELHTLSNGDEYKFTTKKWLTPKGNWVHNNGIKPTIEVMLSKAYYENPIEENDNQLQAALDYLGTVK